MTSFVELKELMDECGLDPALPKLGGDQRLFRSRFEGLRKVVAKSAATISVLKGLFRPAKFFGLGMNESRLPKELASLLSPLLKSESFLASFKAGLLGNPLALAGLFGALLTVLFVKLTSTIEE